MVSNELSYKILAEYSSDIQIRQKRSSNDRLSTSPRQHDGPSQQRQLGDREVEIIHLSRTIGIGYVRGDGTVETQLNIQPYHTPIYIAFRHPRSGKQIICGVVGVTKGQQSVTDFDVNVNVLFIEPTCQLRRFFNRY